MLTFIYASRLVTGGHGRKKRKCQADDAPKKSSCGKFQNPNFDNEGIKIDMAATARRTFSRRQNAVCATAV